MLDILQIRLSNFLNSCENFFLPFKLQFSSKGLDYPITIQWHLTTKCQNNCKHCYMYDPQTYYREKERTLTLRQKIEILNQLDEFGRKYGFAFKHFSLIGGDPLLADDVFDFIKVLRKRSKIVSLVGNPETLTDENCKKLKRYGIRYFNLSLDGMEKTHDLIRGQGSFKRTIDGIKQLDKYGIHSTTMITLSSLNVADFFDVLDYVFYKTKSKGIVFDFCVNIGNAKEIKSTITPETALDIANRYLDKKKNYKNKRPDFNFGEKSGLLRLLHIYRKDTAFYENETTGFTAGCLIGCGCQSILSDGTLLLCRRLPEILGRLPEEKFENIFLSNEIIKKFRRPQFFEDCGKCIGWNWCRGCPGISNGEYGNPYKKPSICYANFLETNHEYHTSRESISMQTTLAEEAKLIKRNTKHRYYESRYKQNISYKVLKTINKLKKSNEANAFIENPKKWFAKNAGAHNSVEKNFIVYHFNAKIRGYE